MIKNFIIGVLFSLLVVACAQRLEYKRALESCRATKTEIPFNTWNHVPTTMWDVKSDALTCKMPEYCTRAYWHVTKVGEGKQ